jgi:hypothetical protein
MMLPPPAATYAPRPPLLPPTTESPEPVPAPAMYTPCWLPLLTTETPWAPP